MRVCVLSPEALWTQSMCLLSGRVKEAVEQRILEAWSKDGSTELCSVMCDNSISSEEGVPAFLCVAVVKM